MNFDSTEELNRRLSEYLDGALSAEEMEMLEDHLASHPEAKEQLRQLRQLKHLVAAGPKLPPDPHFWTRLSAQMKARDEEEENLLPFSRKYIPLASAMGILAIVAVGITAYLQRDSLFRYVTERSQAVKEVYENGILQGTVLPLFANIDNDKVLQFALFGTLPLDAKAETALRVDDQSEQGYHLEVGMTADRVQAAVTVADLYKEVQPTRHQVLMIDSVLHDARGRIAKGAFYGENNALAIDPQLTKLNREVLSNIASVLAPVQRKRFNGFLKTHNATYTIAQERFQSPVEQVSAWSGHARHKTIQYVVITADSTIVAPLALNIDSLIQPHAAVLAGAVAELPARLENLMRVRHERTTVERSRPSAPPPPLQTVSEEDFLKIEIAPQFFPSEETMRVWVTPRVRKEKMFRFEFRTPEGGVRVEEVPGEISAFDVEMDFRGMDSLMKTLTQEQIRHNAQFRKIDSLARARVQRNARERRPVIVDTAGQQ